MDKQQWKKVSRIFDLALTMPAQQRSIYLNELCEDEPELQKEIEAMLESAEKSDQLLDHHLQKNKALLDEFITQAEDSTSYPDADNSLVGQTIGQWQLIELLGHGGMGSVYKAERNDSGIRQVGALKIMHQNLKTPENVQRFKLEQQILAGLNHPNIASRIDGGISNDGLPYLIMEYVKGKPILDYCDSHALSIEERLDLFMQVCKAVQHAHKNLIIHRDLKPENILVTDEGHIKILDFGIAKLLDPDLYEFSTVETRQGMGLMSLQSAAPEQLSGEKITTSTDLYAMGGLLYKLLTGVHPFDLKDKRYRSIAKIIREEDPSAPSQRLNQISETELFFKIADNRSSGPNKLIQKLSGDLDAITLKALRKEPKERYESIGRLIDDLKLYESNKPVDARLHSTRYRLTKFWNRHKKRISIASAAVVIIIGLIAFYTFRLAQERNEAQLEAQKSGQVKNLLIDIFKSGDPFAEPNAKDLSLKDVLDAGSKKVSKELGSQPLVQAELQQALGNVYSGLIMYPRAEPLLHKALSNFKSELGNNHPDIAGVYSSLGFINLRKGNYEQAQNFYLKASDIYEQWYGVGSLRYASVIKNLAYLYYETGKPQKAVDVYNRALTIFKNHQDSAAIPGALNDRGFALMDLSKFEKAVSSFRASVKLTKHKNEGVNYTLSNSLTGLGQIMHLKGNLAAAESLHTRALSIRTQLFEPDHTHIASSQLRLGWVYLDQNRMREAMPLVQKAHASLKQHLPAKHWKVAASKGILALGWIRKGQFKKAEQTLLNTYNIFIDQFGNNDWRTQNARQTLAKLYSAWEKPNIAENYLHK